YQFVMPLFKSAPVAQKRLTKAACLLHDVSWRAHPDFRAEVCFDNATRANLGGLKHSERVFLGLALLHRYRNKREGTRFVDLYDLLDDKGQKQAAILGKAMRFGAMLWMRKDAQMGTLRWQPKKKLLELQLSAEATPLFGEVAEARFMSLANAMDADVLIKRLKK
ncbi:MAG: exopolyphosphatase/guanosine-5'-triphosphate,3'-diphosphate pyrophosphatase, partial [Paracoccaceae bacterium]